MRHAAFLLAALTTASAFGADIQLVAAKGCTDTSCAEGCCNMSDMACCDGCNTGCNPCGNGTYCDPCSGNYGNCNGYYGNCNGGNGNCNGRRCNPRSTWQAYGMNWCHPCGPVGRAARLKVPGAKQLCWCCNTKAFPDSGWAPPSRVPVRYTGNGFASWYGNQGPFMGAPMVYQPTDTAQLGFSYANVPTWQRDPSRIPARPIPSQFHNRSCPCPGNGCLSGGCRNGGCMPTPVMYSTPVQGSTCPCNSSAMMSPMSSMPAAVMMSQAQPSFPTVQAPVRQRTITTVSSATRSAAPQLAQPQRISTYGQNRSQQVRTGVQRSSTSRAAGRRTQKPRGSGWFGLPSLAEMKF